MSVDDRGGGGCGDRTELGGAVVVATGSAEGGPVALSLRKATFALSSPSVVAPRSKAEIGGGGATGEGVAGAEGSVSGPKGAWSERDATGSAADCGTREGFTVLSRTGIGKVGGVSGMTE